jgi:CubicO group peptidase (beta-lactamase class C family)
MKHPPFWLGAILFAAASLTAADYAPIVPKIESVVREEMREWDIGGIAVALVDDQRVVYAAGFGEARRDSVFRVGSISKLFNAVGVLQQVEAGRLDLDAPLPADVSPINPFPAQPKITLRHLLSHRSGLPREGAVGGYMDDSEAGLAATVASVPASVLVTRPGEKTRYSNLAPSVAGVLVERASGEKFEDYQRAHIFKPLGMTNSAWTRARAPRQRLIGAHWRVADERGGFKRQAAPVFDLGTIPAGNLFSSVDDLARFASALVAGGNGLLKTETLERMWTPQFTEEKAGFGLAFMVGKFRAHRAVSHSGAVYGHSTSLVVLPEKKIAVIVLGNEDIVSGRIHRISSFALAQMLAAKFGEPIASSPPPFSPPQLEPFAGDYESQSYWARLDVRGGKLVGDLSGQPTRFNPTGELRFTADSRLEDATPVTFTRDGTGRVTGFALGGQRFQRVPEPAAPLPREWRAVLGSYGPKFIPVIISERHGHLYAMTENMVDYRLTPVNRNVCALPPGMYVDEQVVFLTDRRGRVNEINFANMNFRRRD